MLPAVDLNILLDVINSRKLYFFMNHDFTMSVFAFEPANRRMLTDLSLANYNIIMRLLTRRYVKYHNMFTDMS